MHNHADRVLCFLILGLPTLHDCALLLLLVCLDIQGWGGSSALVTLKNLDQLAVARQDPRVVPMLPPYPWQQSYRLE
jgi:hypothetical protein